MLTVSTFWQQLRDTKWFRGCCVLFAPVTRTTESANNHFLESGASYQRYHAQPGSTVESYAPQQVFTPRVPVGTPVQQITISTAHKALPSPLTHRCT